MSWRILLEDLWSAYEQLKRAPVATLPLKTTSLREWAGRLAEYARSADLEEDIPYWQDMFRAQTGRLPVDHAGQVNDMASHETLRVSLDADQTRALLQEVPSAYRTRIHEVLITALAQALCRWTGTTSVLLDIDGHGREDLFEDMDLSRTTGWFTSVFPVHLDLGGTSDSGGTLKSIKDQLRRVPRRGISYGLLCYMGRDEECSAQLRTIWPEVSFNYLGQLDTGGRQKTFAPFSLVTEPVGPLMSPLVRRRHLLDINGGVVGGRLELAWTYSRNVHERSTIERVVADFVGAVQALIAHCQSPGAGECTPSDFPLARLDAPTPGVSGREVSAE